MQTKLPRHPSIYFIMYISTNSFVILRPVHKGHDLAKVIRDLRHSSLFPFSRQPEPSTEIRMKVGARDPFLRGTGYPPSPTERPYACGTSQSLQDKVVALWEWGARLFHHESVLRDMFMVVDTQVDEIMALSSAEQRLFG